MPRFLSATGFFLVDRLFAATYLAGYIGDHTPFLYSILVFHDNVVVVKVKVGYSAEEMDNLFEWLNENRSLLMSMAKGTRPLSFEEADMMAALILAGDGDDEWDEFEDDDLD